MVAAGCPIEAVRVGRAAGFYNRGHRRGELAARKTDRAPRYATISGTFISSGVSPEWNDTTPVMSGPSGPSGA